METAEPTADGTLLRLSAFAEAGRGGNPAGVWLGERLPAVSDMQRIAARVGFSETAFTAHSDHRWTTRYYSPQAEVSFCGHATIATGVALGQRHGWGTYVLDTAVGPVDVEVDATGDGDPRATLTSVEPAFRPLRDELLTAALDHLRMSPDDLDPVVGPGLAFAGAWHLIVPVTTRGRLAQLDYDVDGLRQLMLAHNLTTVALVHRELPDRFHARNPFPVGGAYEDPATGAAAAALGAHLRERDLLPQPPVLTVLQGHDMGRPSEILVDVPPAGGVRVSGTAVPFIG